jgi:hypothetical protein
MTLNLRALLRVLGSGAIVVALLFFAGLFIISWLCCRTQAEGRGVLALATAARNFGAALAPAANSFDDPKITTMIIVGAIVCVTVSFLAAKWLRQQRPVPAAILANES